MHGFTVMHAGAIVNFRNHMHQTPLHVAAKLENPEGKEELVKLLLDKEADPNISDVNGNIPLDLAAAAEEQHDTVTDLLLDHTTSSATDEIWKAAFKRAMKSNKINDVQHIFRAMSPIRYDMTTALNV